jgi:hypothetical protein
MLARDGYGVLTHYEGAPFHNAFTGEGRANREETDTHLFDPPG